jgi:hypothetical protein
MEDLHLVEWGPAVIVDLLDDFVEPFVAEIQAA